VRDWKKIVRDLDAREDRPWPDEVIAELASHLEDSYDEFRVQGLGEHEAAERVLSSLPEWRRLNHAIQSARYTWRTMNRRTEQLWFPALVTLLAANLLLMVFARAISFWFPNAGPTAIYVPWLVTQPFVGAFGAHLSRRAGGLRSARVLAGLFPSIVIAAVGLLLIPASVFLERNVWAMTHPVLLVLGGLAWQVPVAVALFCGALPFLEIGGLGANSVKLGMNR